MPCQIRGCTGISVAASAGHPQTCSRPQGFSGSAQDEEKPKPKRQRRAKSAPSELPAEEDADGPKAEGEEAPKKKRRAKGPDPNAFGALL